MIPQEFKAPHSKKVPIRNDGIKPQDIYGNYHEIET